MGGVFFVLLINRERVEWACGALVFPAVILGGYLVIRLTISGSPPLIIALLGIMIVAIPTRLFNKLLQWIGSVLGPLRTIKDEDNRQEIMENARRLGEDLDYDIAGSGIEVNTYDELMEQADKLYQLKAYHLAQPVYRKCVKYAQSEEQHQVIQSRIMRCEMFL